jgi:hypothetical protein
MVHHDKRHAACFQIDGCVWPPAALYSAGDKQHAETEQAWRLRDVAEQAVTGWAAT